MIEPALIGQMAATAAVTGGVAWGATRIVLGVLENRQILDEVNERSSHTRPTPRGGGLAVTPVLVLAWWAIAGLTGTLAEAWAPLLLALGLGVLSWIDDLRDLPPLPRFAAGLVASALAVAVLPGGPVFQGWLPGWLDALAATLLLTWFVNLFNFMDGLDGITGTETAAIGLGLAVLVGSGAWPDPALGLQGAAALGVGLGFLALNWHPARIFLGDVGSIPLGLVLGWALLGLAAQGLWAPALILPAYYLADATLTLMRRAARGEKVWRAHKEHFYQKAHQRGLTHDRVVRRIAMANAALIGLAWAGAFWPFPAVAGAIVVVGGLLFALRTATP